jgi:1-acyl-sn-glycerol-3-phosphate acyltransferase
MGRFVREQCIRATIHNRDAMNRDGGYLLAPTHISHVEPMVLSALFERPITWMARIEFFRVPILASMLRWVNSFSVNRQGVPVRAIRTAIDRARNGEIVGVFPEGGCRKGRELAIRGGRIKQGICTIALRAGVPIVPCVVVGTHALNEIEPWLPGQYGKVWIKFGDAILPPPFPRSRRDRRAARRTLAEQLEREYVATYQSLLTDASLRDGMTP